MVLLVVIGVLFLLVLASIPFLNKASQRAGMLSLGSRGKDIFVAITQANTEREPLDLPHVWPRTRIDGAQVGDIKDIASMAFQNSTDYFNELLDGANLGEPEKWVPYVNGFYDYSRFAGDGVPAMLKPGKLKPENNAWCIAGDIREEMDDRSPLLVTRNFDCEFFYKVLGNDEKEPVPWSTQYKTPYSNKGFVGVRKGGAVFSMSSRYITQETIYASSSSSFPTLDDLPPAYLTPDSLVTRPRD